MNPSVSLNVTAKIIISLPGIEVWISAAVGDFVGRTILPYRLCYSRMRVLEKLLKPNDQSVLKNTHISMQTVELVLTEIVYGVSNNIF